MNESDNSSPKSERLQSLYDGDDVVIENWVRGFTPDSYMPVSEWADQYRVLSSKSASEPGRWRTDRTPYLKEIMDCLSPHSAIQKIVFMKGAQIGGTECGNNWIGYIIHQAPGPMMAVSPTVDMAKRNSKQRIDPLIEDCPTIRDLVKPARSRDSGNTILSKEFPGGLLVLTGANSAVGLRSMPARYLFMDEIDGYPRDIEGEGDPILLTERRTATFQKRKKIFLVSTPTVKGLSSIEREFENSDKRYYFVPCPFCGGFQILKWAQIRWEEGVLPIRSTYECEQCQAQIPEHAKTQMLADGRWEATAPSDGLTAGFHLSSLYSPIGWLSWAECIATYEKAKKDKTLMQGFQNTILGETYEEETDAPEWQRLYQMRETYNIGTIPMGGLFLTAGVDIQKDRIECEIVAWGRNKQSWSVDYIVLSGDTAKTEVWQRLDNLLMADYPHENGITMPIRVMAVDSGYATQDVYSFVRQYTQATWGGSGARANMPRTVVAVKGQSRDTAMILSTSKADTKKKGLKVWNVSGPVIKTELYRWLKMERIGEEASIYGWCHFPAYDEEYFKQITAERMVTRIQKGYPKQVWEKDPSRRNEALDCRVYARAAAAIYGLDRFTEKAWAEMEEGIPQAMAEPITPKKKKVRFIQSEITKVDDPWL
ncbi:MAG: phage terminase large subunit family protein [Lactobacillales bacterium]|jgi:phage terminase large subunit GpA-like protein|nr:phage terminase large subunit family protein [Lactobacillales bacterium]